MPSRNVQLVDGGGVFCTKLQLDEAIASASTPTKLARNLLNIFYSPEELAMSTACGKRCKFKAIDKNILSAIVCKFCVAILYLIMYVFPFYACSVCPKSAYSHSKGSNR